MNQDQEKFEAQLQQMSKPTLPHLQHEEMLSKALMKEGDRVALSFWWLSVPVYVIAALLMKSLYRPELSLRQSMHAMIMQQSHAARLVFIVLPLITILISLAGVRQLLYLSLPGKIWKNVVFIVVSAFILFTYFL